MNGYQVLKSLPTSGYALLDSGEGEKLERYGAVLVARPDPQALWRKRLPQAEWQKAQAYFKRESKSAEWQVRGELPKRWSIEFGGLKFWIKLSAFKHTGIFPEQLPNWEWVRERITNPHPTLSTAVERGRVTPSVATEGAGGGLVRILNLFGYTGGATLAAAQAGAEVVHVDGSKVAIGSARDNAELAGLKDKPVRWILDDAVKFVKREIKRGSQYEGIIMDPPAFGHGPGGELWKVEDNFLELLDLGKQILSDRPLFFLVNGYASGYSAIAYKNSLVDLMKSFGGEVEIGELTIAEEKSERLLPCGIFARWASV